MQDDVLANLLLDYIRQNVYFEIYKVNKDEISIAWIIKCSIKPSVLKDWYERGINAPKYKVCLRTGEFRFLFVNVRVNGEVNVWKALFSSSFRTVPDPEGTGAFIQNLNRVDVIWRAA